MLFCKLAKAYTFLFECGFDIRWMPICLLHTFLCVHDHDGKHKKM